MVFSTTSNCRSEPCNCLLQCSNPFQMDRIGFTRCYPLGSVQARRERVGSPKESHPGAQQIDGFQYNEQLSLGALQLSPTVLQPFSNGQDRIHAMLSTGFGAGKKRTGRHSEGISPRSSTNRWFSVQRAIVARSLATVSYSAPTLFKWTG